jgi:hypothetical protein
MLRIARLGLPLVPEPKSHDANGAHMHRRGTAWPVRGRGEQLGVL